jgi:hypothetical protein
LATATISGVRQVSDLKNIAIIRDLKSARLWVLKSAHAIAVQRSSMHTVRNLVSVAAILGFMNLPSRTDSSASAM